ncbi:MAG: UDP-N-acetylglucosamine 1-carboxyvinyltransferase [Rhodothermales bacterium]|jgi:UDP-N-acetylglucosamine 1-carboxyvinyltransferase
MSSLVIEGGISLTGTITAGGNKNAVLPMIAASLLSDEEVILENVPGIRDVNGMLAVIQHLGGEVEREGSEVRIRAKEIHTHSVPRELCNAIRTSFLVAGPLLHRRGAAQLYPPGGDVIGRRRLDAHFYGLTKLGAEAAPERFAFSSPRRLRGRDLFFDEASVTATEHILMTAVLAEGTTVIRNAASEPHVCCLAEMLISMGAQIDGLHTNTLTVQGVDRLHGTRFRVVSDHIEIGSFLALAAATGGSITVKDTVKSHFWMIRRVFEKFGIVLDFENDQVHLPPGQEPRIQKDIGGIIPQIDDGPWPQFPSDLMSAMLVLATQTEGTALFFEKMFESRMYFVDRLIQMGASAIVCDPHRVVISGKSRLRAQTMSSPDIRAGIALLIAACCATGTSVIDKAEIIDRGYENITDKLDALGARVHREP